MHDNTWANRNPWPAIALVAVAFLAGAGFVNQFLTPNLVAQAVLDKEKDLNTAKADLTQKNSENEQLKAKLKENTASSNADAELLTCRSQQKISESRANSAIEAKSKIEVELTDLKAALVALGVEKANSANEIEAARNQVETLTAKVLEIEAQIQTETLKNQECLGALAKSKASDVACVEQSAKLSNEYSEKLDAAENEKSENLAALEKFEQTKTNLETAQAKIAELNESLVAAKNTVCLVGEPERSLPDVVLIPESPDADLGVTGDLSGLDRSEWSEANIFSAIIGPGTLKLTLDDTLWDIDFTYGDQVSYANGQAQIEFETGRLRFLHGVGSGKKETPIDRIEFLADDSDVNNLLKKSRESLGPSDFQNYDASNLTWCANNIAISATSYSLTIARANSVNDCVK